MVYKWLKRCTPDLFKITQKTDWLQVRSTTSLLLLLPPPPPHHQRCFTVNGRCVVHRGKTGKICVRELPLACAMTIPCRRVNGKGREILGTATQLMDRVETSICYISIKARWFNWSGLERKRTTSVPVQHAMCRCATKKCCCIFNQSQVIMSW